MYLLFDIGGTKTRIALASEDDIVGEPEVLPTPGVFEEGIALIGQTVRKLSGGERLKAIAGGIRRLDTSHEQLLPDFRLPDWSGKPLKKRLGELTDGPVYLENDTAMAGLGEAVSGAGRNYEIVVYLTISSGVGGSRVINKRIDKNSLGFEPGHQVIDADWSVYPERKEMFEKEGMGQLEAYISGTSLERCFGKKPQEITDEKVWDELAKHLASGLNNAIVHWSPDVVVLGGGMMKSHGISVDRVKDYLKDILKVFPSLPEIRKAELGDFGGLYGALHYLNNFV
jgi:glucokinase